MEEHLIGSIEKNRTEEFRVRLVEFHDRPFIYIRVFATMDATDKGPTRKCLRRPPIPDMRPPLKHPKSSIVCHFVLGVSEDVGLTLSLGPTG